MLTKSKAILFMLIVFILATLFIFYDYTSRNNENGESTEAVESSGIEETEETEKIEEAEETEETTLSTEQTETQQKETEAEVETEVATEATENISETTESTIEESSDSDTNLVSLGRFRLTAYCNCSKCCGKWAGGATASGVMPVANRTIAVDTSVIPFGTKVVINGNTYVAEDTGSAIVGNRIDIYFDSHQEALNFGVQYAEVFVVKD